MSGRDPRGSSRQSDRATSEFQARRQQRQQAEQRRSQLADELGIDEELVQLRDRQDGTEVRPTDDGQRQLEQRVADRSPFLEPTDVDTEISDTGRIDVRPTDEGQQRAQQRAANQRRSELADELDIDEDQIQTQIKDGVVEVRPNDAGARVLRQRVADRSEYLTPEDIAVRTDEGGQIEIGPTQEGQNRAQERADNAVLDQIRAELPSNDDFIFARAGPDVTNTAVEFRNALRSGRISDRADVGLVTGGGDSINDIPDSPIEAVASADPEEAEELLGIDPDQLESAQNQIKELRSEFENNPEEFERAALENPDFLVERANFIEDGLLQGSRRRSGARQREDQIRDEIASSEERLEAEDINVDVDPASGDVRTALEGVGDLRVGGLQDDFARQRAAEEFDSQTDSNIGIDDVRLEGGRVRLSSDAEEQEVEQQRQEAADELGVDTDDIRLDEDEGQFEVRESAQRELAAEELESQVDFAVSPDDVVLDDGEVRISDSAQREIAAEELENQVDFDVSPDDVVIDDGEARIAESAQQTQSEGFGLEPTGLDALGVDSPGLEQALDAEARASELDRSQDIESDINSGFAGQTTAVEQFDDPLESERGGGFEEFRRDLDEISRETGSELQEFGRSVGGGIATISPVTAVERSITGETTTTDRVFEEAFGSAAQGVNVPGAISGGIDALDFAFGTREIDAQNPAVGSVQFATSGVDERTETIDAGVSAFSESFDQDPVGTTASVAGAVVGGFAVGTATTRGARAFSRSRPFDFDADIDDFVVSERAMTGRDRGASAVDDGDGLLLERTVERSREQDLPEDAVRDPTPDEIEAAVRDPSRVRDRSPDPTVDEIEQAARQFEEQLNAETASQQARQTAAPASSPPPRSGGLEATLFDDSAFGAAGSFTAADSQRQQAEAVEQQQELELFDSDDAFGTQLSRQQEVEAGVETQSQLGLQRGFEQGLQLDRQLGVQQGVQRGLQQGFQLDRQLGLQQGVQRQIQTQTQTQTQIQEGITEQVAPIEAVSTQRPPRTPDRDLDFDEEAEDAFDIGFDDAVVEFEVDSLSEIDDDLGGLFDE